MVTDIDADHRLRRLVLTYTMLWMINAWAFILRASSISVVDIVVDVILVGNVLIFLWYAEGFRRLRKQLRLEGSPLN